MTTRRSGDFLSGVIEGFYGPPWSPAERLELFEWMTRWGLNTYVYAPKDDLKHRALWREGYSKSEARALRELCRASRERRIRFVYALSPGLDIRYCSEADRAHLRKRFQQLLDLGCRDFALLFDDIPDRLDAADLGRYGSFAAAQCDVTNDLFLWITGRCPGARFLFCPTPYCGMMADRKFGGEDYLPIVGRELAPEIDVFWTGPEIISRKITVAHIRKLQRRLGRRPVIWDNLHANDYDGGRFYCGPYAGRPLELRRETNGILLNPNCEFPLNFVPLHTFAAFVRGKRAWNPRQAYLAAMSDWLPAFATVGESVALEDLVLLGDCFYLPHEEGPEAESLFQGIRRQIALNPARRKAGSGLPPAAARLQALCGQLTGLRDRPLFHALSRRIWDLREELALLDQYSRFQSAAPKTGTGFRSDFHLPGTYRGGLVSRLQQLLVQKPDGSFEPGSEI